MNLNLKSGDICGYCKRRSKFSVEWYGLNQYGENPEIIADVSSCRNFRHMVAVSSEICNYLGNPDAVVDYKEDFEYSSLITVLIKALNSKPGSELDDICEQGQDLINSTVPVEGQVMLF